MNLKDISIHAPARGATATNIENGKYSGDFNPRSREGSDEREKCYFRNHRHFNPRSREGSDWCGYELSYT